MSMAEELERLERLRTAGTLTDEEFETAKANLLSGKPAGSDVLGLGGAIDNLASDDNQWAMMIHLSQLLGYALPVAGLAVPIILWQVKKDKSSVIDQHGRVVANWMITELIFILIGVAASFIFIGIPLLMAVAVVGIVFPILGGIKANEGELWPYPMSFVFFPIDPDDLAFSGDLPGSYDSDQGGTPGQDGANDQGWSQGP